jgi:multiple antibiotic resistance protein
MPPLSGIRINDIITITFTLFAIIDVIGSVPIVINIKKQHPNFNPFGTTIFAGVLMLIFLFVGEQLLDIIGIDLHSFALAGSFVVFILGLELISGRNFFKSEKDVGSAGSLVPLAFPVLAGSGTLTTILSLKAVYNMYNIIIAIVINLIVMFVVLKSVDWIERKLGKAGILVLKKFFGVILIAIAIKIFEANFFKGGI